MLQKIIKIIVLTQKFGLWNGIRLSIQLFTGRLQNIRIPNIKHSISLRQHTSDLSIFYQVFINNEYNIKFDKKPNIIIDAGSNIGLFAIKMKNEFPESTIICIEPDYENLQILQKNILLYKDVFLENSGLWNKDTKLKVYDKYNSGKWGMVVEEDIITGTVNAISLNSLLDKYSLKYVDILKLDIETSEKQLFSDNYEDWLPKIKTIIIELHDWMEEGCSKPFFTAINKSFTKYKFSHIGENIIITNEDIK